MSSPRCRAALLAAALACACGRTYAPLPVALDADALARASSVLHEAGSRRGDIRPVEGGFVLEAYFWQWRERLAWDGYKDRPFDDDAFGPLAPMEQERFLAGPREIYLTPENVTSVRILTYPLGGALVEIGVAGETGPALLETGDAAEAETLALALDVLRRAAVAEGAPATGPADVSGAP